MPVFPPLELAVIGVALLLSVAAILGIRAKDNSIVDVFWGPAFLVAAWGAFIASSPSSNSMRAIVALTVVTLWALRLASHIGGRRKHHSGEDWRYAAWRKQWGDKVVVRSIGQVYLLQAVLALLASTAVFICIGAEEQALDGFVIAGLMIWIAGILVEIVADRQLASFVARKRSGEVSGFCTEGLWQYSRHPNYFGEAIAWWGISVMALGATGGWVGLVTGVIVTGLVRYVSGVPILEREWRNRPGFAEWTSAVPIFMPIPQSLRRNT